MSEAEKALEEPMKDRRVNLSTNYNTNSVRSWDTVGAIFLGILSVILLLALLSAHRRERKAMAGSRQGE